MLSSGMADWTNDPYTKHQCHTQSRRGVIRPVWRQHLLPMQIFQRVELPSWWLMLQAPSLFICLLASSVYHLGT